MHHTISCMQSVPFWVIARVLSVVPSCLADGTSRFGALMARGAIKVVGKCRIGPGHTKHRAPAHAAKGLSRRMANAEEEVVEHTSRRLASTASFESVSSTTKEENWSTRCVYELSQPVHPFLVVRIQPFQQKLPSRLHGSDARTCRPDVDLHLTTCFPRPNRWSSDSAL